MNEQLEVGLYEDIRSLLGIFFYRYQVRILKLPFYQVHTGSCLKAVINCSNVDNVLKNASLI